MPRRGASGRGRDNVFPDPGMTVAAIDRLAHHSTIFELNDVESCPGQSGCPPTEDPKIQRENAKAQRGHRPHHEDHLSTAQAVDMWTMR